MAVTKIPAETARALVRPAWLRAVITVAFAIFTIFWQNDTLTLAQISLAAFFVLGATALWDYVKADPVPPALRGPIASGAAVWVLSGIAAVFAASTAAVAIIAGVGFLAMGLAELVGGLRVRKEFVPARDHVILGVVGTLTGVGLFLGVGLDPHGILGISGMGVIVMAVLLLISSAGLSYEAKRSGS